VIGRAARVGLRLLLLVAFLVGCSNRTTDSTSPGPSTPPSASAGSAAAAPSGAPSEVPGDDRAAALAIATAFETARAAGDWDEAWALLSDDAQAAVGPIEDFASLQGAYNAAGGSRFVMQAPTQDPELLANTLGAGAAAIDVVADMSRGYLFFILHPDVAAASAGTTAVFAARLDSGDWRIWLVR
jgi:hypothetical protein